MKKALKLLAAFSVLLSVFLCSLISAYVFNTDFGKVERISVKICTDGEILTGLLYRPADCEGKQFPAIVVAHGISESAQMLSSFGLELCRGGFVVLCLDLPGHGGSDGFINQGQQNPALRIDEAVNYLSDLPYVDSTRIGLVGHSLGAGAVRAAATKLSNVQASVLVGGGVGGAATSSEYGYLNATYPKNTLVIIGKYDVLFDLTALANKDLLELFNTTDLIKPDVVYGDFSSQTARKLIVPQTTHLFESLDAAAIIQTTAWMQQTLADQTCKSQLCLIYQYREIAQALSVLTLVGLVLFAFYPIAALLKLKQKTCIQNTSPPRWKAYLAWFVVNLSLFFPLIAFGFVIPFPPLIFGSAIAWWLLLLAIISIFFYKRIDASNEKTSVVNLIKQNLPTKKTLLVAVALFLVAVAVTSCLQAIGLSLKIIAPIFQEFASLRRVLVFLEFLPFFYPYFVAQQLYLLPKDYCQKRKRDYLTIIFVTVSPFLLFLALNFLPKTLFDFWIIPSFAGFLIEFLWLMVPIFIITTFCSIYLYNRTKNFVLGTIFNMLILAWIAATVFPF
jgi:dienelactone hydrolase